jgi:hypothetical protein
MDWVSPHKTPPVEAILYQGVPCTSLDQLWNTLHSTFNSALDRPIGLSVLGDKWESPSIRAWVPYSAVELSDALTGTSNQSAPRLDHIMWRQLKCIVRDRFVSRLFHGWQTLVCSLATGLLNSRPLLRWLYQNQVNCRMTLSSHFSRLFF